MLVQSVKLAGRRGAEWTPLSNHPAQPEAQLSNNEAWGGDHTPRHQIKWQQTQMLAKLDKMAKLICTGFHRDCNEKKYCLRDGMTLEL